jgi:5-methylcytosine-specific restriction endonuclease McrA
MKKYMAERRKTRRADLIARLGGMCTVCGTTENLEIDHINPDDKSFILSGYHLDKSWNELLNEIDKCQALCSTHHKEKTAAWLYAKVSHGSETMYLKYKCRCDVCVEGYSVLRKRHPSRSSVA